MGKRLKTYKLDKKTAAWELNREYLYDIRFYLTRTSPASHPRYQVALLSVSYVYSLCSASTPLRRGVQCSVIKGSASCELT